MKPPLLLCAAALAALLVSPLSAQDYGALAVFEGNPNKDNATANGEFEQRTLAASIALGQRETLLLGFVNHNARLERIGGETFSPAQSDAAWWRNSMVQSTTSGNRTPILSIGLADTQSPDSLAEMNAIGNPADTVYGVTYQAIIDGFKNAGFKKMYLRIGWEQNGEWYPWRTVNLDKTHNPTRAAAYVAAWRRVADLAHNTPGIEVKTVWSPTFGRCTPTEVAATYPGDAYVDVIAPDIYSGLWGSQSNAWKENTSNRQSYWDQPGSSYGLQAMIAFAIARNKPFGLTEAGVEDGTNGTTYLGPHDFGDFPLYLAKRIHEGITNGLKLEYVGLWNIQHFRFNNGHRPADTAGFVTLVNQLAGAEVLQAENLSATASHPVSTLADPGATGNFVLNAANPYVLAGERGGNIRKLDAVATGNWIEFTVPVPAPGVYNVKLRTKTHPSRGQFQLWIDGVAQGAPQDFYSITEKFIIADFGSKTFATAGNKTFRFTCTGGHANASGRTFVADYIDLTPRRQEAERLPYASATDPVSLFTESAASRGAGEKLESNASGDSLLYSVPVLVPGTYRIEVRVKKHETRGVFQLSVDGANQSGPQDLYAPYGTPTPYTVLNLGNITFDRTGHKDFRFTVTGKNASSSGYTLAFDYIELVPQ